MPFVRARDDGRAARRNQRVDAVLFPVTADTAIPAPPSQERARHPHHKRAHVTPITGNRAFWAQQSSLPPSQGNARHPHHRGVPVTPIAGNRALSQSWRADVEAKELPPAPCTWQGRCLNKPSSATERCRPLAASSRRSTVDSSYPRALLVLESTISGVSESYFCPSRLFRALGRVDSSPTSAISARSESTRAHVGSAKPRNRRLEHH